jgi:hypothetical protein
VRRVPLGWVSGAMVSMCTCKFYIPILRHHLLSSACIPSRGFGLSASHVEGHGPLSFLWLIYINSAFKPWRPSDSSHMPNRPTSPSSTQNAAQASKHSGCEHSRACRGSKRWKGCRLSIICGTSSLSHVVCQLQDLSG